MQTSLSEWSSPVRRDETGKPLVEISNELYRHIVDLTIRETTDRVAKLRQLARLALVCRFFWHLATPRAFETMTLDCTAAAAGQRGPFLQFSKLCQSLVENEVDARNLKVAKYVTACTFLDSKVGKESADILKQNFAALRFMDNLKILELRHHTLTRQTLEALPHLQHLSTLKLVSYSFDGECRTWEGYKDLEKLDLVDLTLIPDTERLQDELDGFLVKALDHSKLLSLSTSLPASVDILKELGLSTRLPLRTLDMLEYPCATHPPDDSLFRLLPELRTLTLADMTNSVLQLNPTSIPLLEELNVFECDVIPFMTGRPISRITIITDVHNESEEDIDCSFTNDIFSAIKQSTAPTISLALSEDLIFYSLDYGRHLNGKVAELTLLHNPTFALPLETWHWILKNDLLGVLREMPDLRIVRIILDSETHPGYIKADPLLKELDLEETHRFLMQLPKDIRMEELHFGRIVWTKRSDRSWTPRCEDEKLRDKFLRQAAKLDDAGRAILFDRPGRFLDALLR